MEQVMIGLQEKFIELDNDRVNQPNHMDQPIRENIQTKQTLHQLLYLINYVYVRVN